MIEIEDKTSFFIMRLFLITGSLFFVLNTPVFAQTKSIENKFNWENISWVLLAAMLGISANWLSQLLSSGANHKVVEEINNKLQPFITKLEHFDTKLDSFDKTLNTLNGTLTAIQQQQNNDKQNLQQEITALGNSLRGRLSVLEKDSDKHNELILEIRETLGEIKGRLASKNHD